MHAGLRSPVRLALIVAAALAVAATAAALEDPPAWAYPMNPPDLPAPVDDGVPRTMPGSTAAYTVTQLTNVRAFVAPDWYPEAHPPMPEVVAKGRAPAVFACGFCHRAEGTGGPENASLAGLPAAYILQQLSDYKNGRRGTSVAKRGPQASMIATSKALSDEDAAAAASYFAALKPRANIQVVESPTAPRTVVAGWFLAPVPDGGTEALGARIVEVPDDLHQFEYRNPRTRFTAYVPPGSIARGERMVRTGGDRTQQCAACHGADMKGTEIAPPVAGRSPSYLVRQLYDFQSGARAGQNAALMKPIVASLRVNDMIDLAAYLASLAP